MGTQPLQRESSLRKPSSIGEEIRKELEKRGLRAPRSEGSKPNGNKIASSGDAPIQIMVTKDSQEEVDIEVKPFEQTGASEITDDDREAALEFENMTVEHDEADHTLEAIEIDEESHVEAQDEDPPVVQDFAEPDGPDSTADSVDTKPLDSTDTGENIEIEEITEKTISPEPVVLLLSKVAPAESETDTSTQVMREDPDHKIPSQEKTQEIEIEFEASTSTEEPVAEPIRPPGDEELVEEQYCDYVNEAGASKALANDLPETAELDDETIEVLKSYKNVKTSYELSLDQADKSDVIESLLSIASHELRSPLQAISGFLELLVNRGASDTRQEEQFLSIAYRESNHLADIVADLEAASLIESGRLNIRTAPFSMERLLQSCIQRFNQPAWEGQIFLADARLKDLPDLNGDEVYLRQAINNLIGAVLRPLRSGNHVFIRTIVEEYNLILQVISGEENPSDKTLPDLRAARGEFYDISQEGLGIFVARHLIEAHGGLLMTQGTEKEGLSYTIQLPLKPRLESKGTVLITEDNTHAALLMEYALERDGYIPIKATNGLEALEIVTNDSIDLVILDVVLPGMDGFEICYRMRSSPETASIPVVIVSARSGDEYRAKALRVGADAYFKKPLVLADLLSTMESLLEDGDMNSSDEGIEEAGPE